MENQLFEDVSPIKTWWIFHCKVHLLEMLFMPLFFVKVTLTLMAPSTMAASSGVQSYHMPRVPSVLAMKKASAGYQFIR